MHAVFSKCTLAYFASVVGYARKMFMKSTPGLHSMGKLLLLPANIKLVEETYSDKMALPLCPMSFMLSVADEPIILNVVAPSYAYSPPLSFTKDM